MLLTSVAEPATAVGVATEHEDEKRTFLAVVGVAGRRAAWAVKLGLCCDS